MRLLALAALLAGLLTGTVHANAADPADFTLRPGANQLYVLDATPGTDLDLVQDGAVVQSGTVDALGSLAWRESTPASTLVAGHRRHDPGTSTTPAPAAVVLRRADARRRASATSQTRDGTTLSANVSFPAFGSTAPYPTVVEYSGYDPSNPDEHDVRPALQRRSASPTSA